MSNLRRIKENLETLRDISETDNPREDGTTRLSYTPIYREAVEYLKEEMNKYGIEPVEDGIGNLYGNLKGCDPKAPLIISGSHLDTVKYSGYFDGQAGIICALEAARMIVENEEPLQSTFQVLATIMEDGARFPVLGGSRFIAGEFDEKNLDLLIDDDGITLRQAMLDYGLSGDIGDVCRKGENIKAFLELHLEQFISLEKAQIPIGIVETILGSHWYMLTVHGAAAHPSTPMDFRRDSSLASYKFISDIADVVVSRYKGKATVTSGKVALHPGVINAIPSRATFSLDIRGGDQAIFKEIDTLIREQIKKFENDYRVKFQLELLCSSHPVANTPKLVDILEKTANELKIDNMRLNSGATHDTVMFSKICDTAMIFVPSKDGLTHCPEEWTDYENLVKGADVLYHAIRKIDKM